jgi:hypothetical protein
MKIERHKRLFNIWMWVLVFVMVLTSSVLSIVGREVGLMWGWPFLIMVIIMNSNRQYEHRLDVMKISMNTEIIGKIKNSRA